MHAENVCSENGHTLDEAAGLALAREAAERLDYRQIRAVSPALICLTRSRMTTIVSGSDSSSHSRSAARSCKRRGGESSYQRGSRNPRPPDPLAFCLRYSA
jgi:hypothetical protein